MKVSVFIKQAKGEDSEQTYLLGVVSSRKQVNLNSLDQWKKLIFYYKLR
jgi:hypothetical protein